MKKDLAVLVQQAVKAMNEHGNETSAARALGIARTTLQKRLEIASREGVSANTGRVNPNDPAVMAERIKLLTNELKTAQASALTHAAVRSEILRLNDAVTNTAPPEWTLPLRTESSAPGVPTLFMSDLHWGEVVDPKQINGKNEYNIEIAHRRLESLGESAVHLLKILDPKMRYPGVVLMLGGDNVSGNIHDELSQTNELQIMPTVLDLYAELVKFITYMADTFRRVFLPCVTGNHGRDTHKIYNKDRHATSFDWLLYGFLAKHFEARGDKRVTFLIPDGPDAYFKIYDHSYLLTHGDQFRGGDGLIGALGPILRGHHKKLSRNAQIDMTFDTMAIGHFHQDIFLRRLIANSCTKGYDEYAYANNFPFEPPSQQLWVTHPKHGITYRMPVLVERTKQALKTAWVSVPA